MELPLNTHLEYLFALERKGVNLGLGPTRDLLAACGNPQHSFPSIQIAGTNGKGSTAAIASWILQQHGKTAGLFTSPHLYRFNERIRVNTATIDDDYITHWIQKHKQSIEDISTTFFETNTVMALCYFRDLQVDMAVLETGLGGRLDATTAITPVLTAITPIDFDHTEILGKTRTAIAREKAGILKSNVPCYSAPQAADAQRVIETEAERVGAPLFFVSVDNSRPRPPRMPGPHQGMNATLGLRIAEAALGPEYDQTIAEHALQTAFWPGRYHLLQEQPRIVFDVAHNPHGVTAFLETMQSEDIRGQKWLVMALQKDKRADTILDLLCPAFDRVIITQTGTRNFLAADTLAAMACRDRSDIQAEPDAVRAIGNAITQADNDDYIAILGSHYLGVAVAKVFKISFDNF